jgi:aminopeptidase N
MMRYVLDGDAAMQSPASQQETLFQGLNYYLTTHAARAADSTELLRSIWTRTGHELGWFFDEWVFHGGHPDYLVSATYDPVRRMEVIKVTQTQKVNANTPVFEMPIDLAFFGAGKQRGETRIQDDAAEQEFTIPLSFAPRWVDFDPDDVLYKTVVFDKTDDELSGEARRDPHMMSRLWAAQQLGVKLRQDQSCCVQALKDVLDGDSFYGVRLQAAASLGEGKSEQAKQALLDAMSQSDSRVRAAAVSALGNFLGDRAVVDILLKALRDDPSYAVQAAAAVQLGRSGDAHAFAALRSESKSNLQEIVAVGILDAMAASQNPQAARVLLDYAQPGTPQRVREHALSDLPSLKSQLQRLDGRALVRTVGDALSDPYLPVHEAGAHLVDVFKLTQFAPVIERDARQAVIMDDRNDARHTLRDLEKP